MCQSLRLGYPWNSCPERGHAPPLPKILLPARGSSQLARSILPIIFIFRQFPSELYKISHFSYLQSLFAWMFRPPNMDVPCLCLDVLSLCMQAKPLCMDVLCPVLRQEPVSSTDAGRGPGKFLGSDVGTQSRRYTRNRPKIQRRFYPPDRGCADCAFSYHVGTQLTEATV